MFWQSIQPSLVRASSILTPKRPWSASLTGGCLKPRLVRKQPILWPMTWLDMAPWTHISKTLKSPISWSTGQRQSMLRNLAQETRSLSLSLVKGP